MAEAERMSRISLDGREKVIESSSLLPNGSQSHD